MNLEDFIRGGKCGMFGLIYVNVRYIILSFVEGYLRGKFFFGIGFYVELVV